MWSIVAVNTNLTPNTSVLFGGVPGQQAIGPNGPLGPTGARYVLAFPSQGYMTLIDKGNTVPGGDWSVEISNATGAKYWFYGGGGRMTIDVNAAGQYTVSGGSGANIVGHLIPWFS